jgi:hypothetical protein
MRAGFRLSSLSGLRIRSGGRRIAEGIDRTLSADDDERPDDGEDGAAGTVAGR